MTTCIKCGKPVADRELFCAQCSKGRLQEAELRLDDEQPRGKTAPVKTQKQGAPRQQAAQRQPAVQYSAAKQPPSGRKTGASGTRRGAPWGVVIALAIVCAALAGFGIWQVATRARANVAVRVREAELDARAHTMDELQIELDAKEEALHKADAQIAELTAQLDTLKAVAAQAESSMNQSQYDLTTQQAALEQLQKKNETLTAEAEELRAAIVTLGEENDRLSEAQQKNEKKLNFMDSYVVFVEDDGTGWYHTYDCAYFTQRSFWAYSRKLAEKNSYKPCPHCFG